MAGYVDPAPAGLPALTEQGISAGKSYGTIEALNAAEAPDLLLIGSPNHLHPGHLTNGLAHGKWRVSDEARSAL